MLIVDDSSMNVQVLGQTLRQLGYEVSAATSGQGALEAINARPIDLVLLDIIMPDLSGKEVLRKLRATSSTADLPVILVSGLDETQDIVEGLELGANDYVTKPINLPVLQARLATQTALKRARDDLKRTAHLLAAEIDQNAQELQVAGQVQRSILPRPLPRCSNLATAWTYEPAGAVSGDLFDIVPLTRHRTLLMVADAMGHGVQAALVVSAVKATLAAHLNEADNLPILMGLLDLAIGDMFEDRYVTVAACVIDHIAHRMQYALAGHPPILVAGTRGVAALNDGGLPLGTHLGLTFPAAEVPLDPGATVLLYTDGATDVEGPGNEAFGPDRLGAAFAAVVGSDPGEVVASIRGSIEQFGAARPLRDDLTILAARLLV